MATKKAAPAAKKVLSAEEKAAKFQEAVAYTDKLVKKAQAAVLKFEDIHKLKSILLSLQWLLQQANIL